MKKFSMLAALSAAVVASGLAVVASPVVGGHGNAIETRSLTERPVAEPQGKSVRYGLATNTRAAFNLRRTRWLTAHKTRAPGERAHRRWRKRRSAGRG